MKKVLLLFVLVSLYGFFSFNIAFSQAQGAPREPITVQPLPKKETPPLKSDGTKTPPEDNGKTAGGSPCDPEKDIMLNISIPFIGRCIKKDGNANAADDSAGNTTAGNVFPKLIGGMTRLVMTAIYIIGFLGILVGGFMIASDGAFGTKEKGKEIIVMIIGGLILLGAAGIILNFINPDFFGTES